MLSHDDKQRQLVSIQSSLALPAAITIRPWSEADFSAIQDLSDIAGWTTPSQRPEDALNAWQHSWPALVAVDGNAVIGFVRAITDGTVTMYIGELLVVPEWQGQGVGSALLEVCHQLFPSTRLDLLSTEAADAFYEARGFRPFRGFRKTTSRHIV